MIDSKETYGQGIWYSKNRNSTSLKTKSDSPRMPKNFIIFKIYYKTIVYQTGPFSEDLILYIWSTTCYLLAIIVKYIF